MKFIQVRLPATLRDAINARVKAGGFKDASEYLCHLVCQDEARASVRTMEEELADRLRAEKKPVSEAEAQRIKREIGERRQEELRSLIAVGIEEADRGEVAPLDIEAIISEGKRRLAAARARGEAVG
jgi:Arc/MetJ-type ribon-helix-helix transcriptional regulator